MLRALLFLILVVALVLLVVSQLKSAPRRPAGLRRVDAEDEPDAPLALPAPPEQAARSLSRATAMHFLYELALGAPAASAVPAEHVEIVIGIAHALERVDPRLAPRRPLLLPALVRAVNDSDTTRKELVRLIARDPALVGSLLALAQSPLHRRGPQCVESLERALAILGTNGTRALVAAASLKPVFRASDGAAARFAEIAWEHTERSAAAAEVHATAVESSDAFTAQLAALVMGLGAVVVYRAALEWYAARGVEPQPAALKSLLETETAKVARQIAASWELSDRVLDALDEQRLDRVEPPASSLGRSLEFGLLVGALSVLRSHGRIDDEAGLATLRTAGGEGERFERLWTRLTWPPGREAEVAAR